MLYAAAEPINQLLTFLIFLPEIDQLTLHAVALLGPKEQLLIVIFDKVPPAALTPRIRG